MEEETIETYVKMYTELEGLQKAARVEYTLRRKNGALSLTVCRAPDARVAICPLKSMEESAARRLLCFVYENGLPPEQLADVVQDVGMDCAN